MNPLALARWQWADYSENHRTKRNLRIHIVAVPLFLAGNVGAVVGLVMGIDVLRELSAEGIDPWWLVLPVLLMLPGLLLSAGAMAVQGAGHKGEAKAPKPFTGPLNVMGRIFMEQWVTFPRFVLSGGWTRALRAA